MGGDLNEFFNLTVGLKQGCMMSLWLFSVYMDGVMKEIQGKKVDAGVPLMREGRDWRVPVLLFAYDSLNE